MEEKNEKQYLRTARWYGIMAGAVALFYAAVCTPVSQWAYADIAVSDIFRLIWDFLQSAVRFSFYWISAAFILSSIRRFEKSKRIILFACGASALLNFASLAAGLIMTHETDTLLSDLLGAVLSVLLDTAQILFFRLIAYLTLERRTTATVPARSILFCAVLPAILQVIGRLVYDFAYGKPAGKEELILMICYYLTDLASIAIGYLVILLITERLMQHKESHP